MEFRGRSQSIGMPDLPRRKLGELLGMIWLAAIPFFISLLLKMANDVSQQSANALVAILALCSLLLLIKVVRKGVILGHLGRITLIAGFFFWYAYPAVVVLFSPMKDFGADLPLPIDPETVISAVAYLSLFLLSAVLALTLFSPAQPQIVVKRSISPITDPQRLLRFALVGCAVGLVPIFLLGGGISETLGAIVQSRAVEKPWLQTANLGNSTSAFTYLTSSGMIAGTCLLWAAVQDRRISFRLRLVVGVLALAFSALLFVDQGTRSVSALVLIPPLALSIANLWQRSRKRATLILLLSIGGVILLFQFQLLFRIDYTRVRLTESLLQNWTTLAGTIDYFKETLMAVVLVPTYHDYFKESVLQQFLISPIPRFLWSSKPASEVVWFYSLWRWNMDIYQESGNVFPGLVGQFYMSWGTFGPVMAGLLMGWIVARADVFLKGASTGEDLYRSVAGIMLLVWAFVSFRVLSPGFFYPVLMTALIVRVSCKRGRTSLDKLSLVNTNKHHLVWRWEDNARER